MHPLMCSVISSFNRCFVHAPLDVCGIEMNHSCSAPHLRLKALLGFRAATPSTGSVDGLSPMTAVTESQDEEKGTRRDGSGAVLKCVECSENAPPPLPLPPARGQMKGGAHPETEINEARGAEGHGQFGADAAIKALNGGANVLSRMDPMSTATALLVDMVLAELVHNQPFLDRDPRRDEDQNDGDDGKELERPRESWNDDGGRDDDDDDDDDDRDDDHGGSSGDDDSDQAADDVGDEEGDDLVLQSSAPSVSLLSMSYGRKVKKVRGSTAGSSFDEDEDDDTVEDSISLSSYGSSFGSSLLGLGFRGRPRVVGSGSSTGGDRDDNAKAGLGLGMGASISDGNSDGNGDGDGDGNGFGGRGDGGTGGRAAMAGTGGAFQGDVEDDAIGALHRTLEAFDSRLFAGGAVEFLREESSGGGGENRGGVCRRCNDVSSIALCLVVCFTLRLSPDSNFYRTNSVPSTLFSNDVVLQRASRASRVCCCAARVASTLCTPSA